MMIKDWIKKRVRLMSGVLIGAVAGFSYWHFVGCASGSCSITSVWYNSTIYGAILGGFLVNAFSKKADTENELKTKNENHERNK